SCFAADAFDIDNAGAMLAAAEFGDTFGRGLQLSAGAFEFGAAGGFGRVGFRAGVGGGREGGGDQQGQKAEFHGGFLGGGGSEGGDQGAVELVALHGDPLGGALQAGVVT